MTKSVEGCTFDTVSVGVHISLSEYRCMFDTVSVGCTLHSASVENHISHYQFGGEHVSSVTSGWLASSCGQEDTGEDCSIAWGRRGSQW